MSNAIANALRIAAAKTERNPTDAQKEAGNYAKGKVRLHGMDIAIENPKGGERSGVGRDGKRWSVKMPAHYGYVLGTEGRDGDHVDVYIGPEPSAQKVFVVDQIDAESGKFDEHKAMLGYPSKGAALADYERAFSDGKAKDRIGAVTELSVDDFRAWCRSGSTKKPIGGNPGYATGGAVMPLIKSDKKSAVSSNIKAEIAAGKPRDQAIAIALDVARRSRAKKADGGEVRDPFDAPAFLVRDAVDVLPDIPRRDDRPTGLPTELDEVLRSAQREEGLFADANRSVPGIMSPFLDAASLGAEVTGIPSIVRGYGNIRRGADEGDAIRGIGGAGQVVLGAIPGASLTRGVLSRAANALMPNLPAAVATTAGLSFPAAYADDAEAASKSAAAAILDDPEVKALKAERDKIMSRRDAINKEHARSGKETQRQALEPYNQQLRALDGDADKPGLIAQAEMRARAKHVENAPFRERHPGAPAALMAGALAGAGGWGAMKGLGKSLGDLGRARSVNRATAESEKAFDDVLAGTNTVDAAARAQDLLRRRIESWNRKHSPVEVAYQATGNAAKGAILGAEGSAAPEQIDYISFEPGHPARERAAELFKRPDYWLERAVPAVSGATAASFGQQVGKGLGTAMTVGRNRPDMDRAQAVAERGAGPSLFDRLIGRSEKGASEEALDRVNNYLTQSAKAQAKGLTTQQERGKLLESHKRLRRGTAEARRRSIDRAGAEDISPSPGDPPVPPPSSASSTNPPSSSPPKSKPKTSESSAKPQDKTKGLPALPSQKDADSVEKALRALGTTADGHPSSIWVPSRPPKAEPTVIVKTPRRGGGWYTRNEDGKFRGGRVVEKPRGAPSPTEHGLEIARRYANGGVVVGPVVGATGGRADELPVEVPSGSFVIPADIVSGLGQGNTLAGMNKLQETFGQAKASGGAQPVAIKISDGEFVLTPEQVAQIGGGDMETGHKILDQLVVKLRQQIVNHMASLPPPSK